MSVLQHLIPFVAGIGVSGVGIACRHLTARKRPAVSPQPLPPALATLPTLLDPSRSRSAVEEKYATALAELTAQPELDTEGKLALLRRYFGTDLLLSVHTSHKGTRQTIVGKITVRYQEMSPRLGKPVEKEHPIAKIELPWDGSPIDMAAVKEKLLEFAGL